MTSVIMQQAQLNLFRAEIKHHFKTENGAITLKPSLKNLEGFISLESLMGNDAMVEFQTWLEQTNLSIEFKPHFNPYQSSWTVTPKNKMASIPSDLLTTEHLSFLAQQYEKETAEIQQQAQNALMEIQTASMIHLTTNFLEIK